MMILLSSFLTIFSCASPLSVCVSLILMTFLFTILSKHDLDIFSLYGSFQLDSLSSPLLTLTAWITLLMILASFQIFNQNKFQVYFSLSIMSLFLALVLTFYTNDILLFYLYFEMSLIPTLILILGWGYQPERLQAGVYMLLYTVLASLPLLGLLLVWVSWSSSSHFFYLLNLNLLFPFDILWFLASLMAFSVKLPMYALHLWLPKAHVEAPVAGSMILAGILLKLGGYGVLRLISKLPSLLTSWAWLLIFWAMLGGTLISFLCIYQVDVKSLIALSSVAHMAMVLSASLTLSVWGMNGSLIIMLGHGFCSSGLFCIANMAYERTLSRSLFLMKGMMTVLPVLTLWWFLLCTSNMAAPPSLNLMGEIHSIMALLLWSKFLLLPISFLVFMAAAYSLYLYTATQHSKSSALVLSMSSISSRELLTLLLHWLPLNLFILKPNLFLMYL